MTTAVSSVRVRESLGRRPVAMIDRPRTTNGRVRQRSEASARIYSMNFTFLLVAVVVVAAGTMAPTAASSSSAGTAGGGAPTVPNPSVRPPRSVQSAEVSRFWPNRVSRWLDQLFVRRTTVPRQSSTRQTSRTTRQLPGPFAPLSSSLNETSTSPELLSPSQPRGDVVDDSSEGVAVAAGRTTGGRPRRYHDTSAALASTVSELLRAALRDKDRLAWIAASSVQVGLLLYLAHAAWKAVAEVVEEYSAELAASASGMEPLFCKPDQATRAVAAFEQLLTKDHRPDVSQDDSASAVAVAMAAMSPPLINVIRRLIMSGVPLRSTPDRPTSVVSVLAHLTKTEATILQQTLWTPPPPSPSRSGGILNFQAMWSDVAGLFPVKERLLGALATLKGRNPAHNAFRGLFDDDGESIAASSNQGILLYGPPGCGKTLLVRALATTARLPCLTITPSTLLRKYVGETNSQVRNLFSLAQKLAPCILCIDELDGLFRERSDSEHEVSRDLKTEFLQWWDGMLSDATTSATATSAPTRQPILVIGASNRPFDVDAAVLRRLSASYYVGLPDAATRTFFLRRLLEKIPSDVDLHRVAMLTEGYSPSDLRQLLQSAAVMGPMKEFSLRRRSESGDEAASADLDNPRPRKLETRDILMALSSTPPTPMSPEYRRALRSFAQLSHPQFATPESHRIGDELDSSMRDSKWETSEGTFYHIGQLDVDPQTFDTLFDLFSQFSTQSEEGTDHEEDDDSDIE